MRFVTTSRPAGSKFSLAIAAAAMAVLLAGPVHAQDAACEELGKKLDAYGKLMQRVQGFQKKKPTADEACAAFTNLQSAGKAALPAFEQNGAWCHVPDQAITNIKAQQDQIAKVRANACNVAAQMKKQQQQGGPGGGGLLGGGEVLGGPRSIPQGAP